MPEPLGLAVQRVQFGVVEPAERVQASGTSLDEVTPPSAPRFSPSDGAALERLMLRLADAPREASAEELIAWAARFNREAYRQRLAALIEEL
ncbi:hypothetical protein ACV34C_32040, partial [Pseudomonas aeruginosa]